MYGIGVSAAALPMPLFGQAAAALAGQAKSRRQDPGGAGTLGRQRRPQHAGPLWRRRLLSSTAQTSASARKDVRPIDDHFGFSRGMAGFERLYKNGKLAIVHGCGYENPSFSHFTSMAYWHTAAPNSGEQYGWVGRLADAMAPDAPPNFIVNIDTRQSLAVRSRRHVPVVFDDPNKFSQEIFYDEREALPSSAANRARSSIPRGNSCWTPRRAPSKPRRWCAKRGRNIIRRWITESSDWICPRWRRLIDAGMPTRLYYTAYRNNAFDTHVFQNDMHKRLLTYASDAVAAFLQDLERIGRADDVVVMVFSEFGRRVPENVNLGTDHGAANLMFVAGKQVKGGQYGTSPQPHETGRRRQSDLHYRFPPRLRDHDRGMAGAEGHARLLNGDFEPFDMFQRA